MKRPVRRVDANQAEIVNALRACGAFVLHTHTLGQGVPDIFVFFNERWTPIEIKSCGGRMTLDECAWWQELGLEPKIAHDDQEAMKLCGIPIVPFGETFQVPCYRQTSKAWRLKRAPSKE